LPWNFDEDLPDWRPQTGSISSGWIDVPEPVYVFKRIELSSSAVGPAHYTFLANPHIYKASDVSKIARHDLLHQSISQGSCFDSDYRVLTWSSYNVSDSLISSMVTYLRSIEGKLRYINFNSISSCNAGWPSNAQNVSSASWKKARIVSIEAKYKSGGRVAYETLELTVQPELYI
jgi:hypothetical protein